ncbi:MAG TPA: hypothetical protein VGR78_09215 [Verrucomicrobiae bacterium]|jgi:hypothetical protein|nr:hypothetical protein [Verrucomicrobiae bacterium]
MEQTRQSEMKEDATDTRNREERKKEKAGDLKKKLAQPPPDAREVTIGPTDKTGPDITIS